MTTSPTPPDDRAQAQQWIADQLAEFAGQELTPELAIKVREKLIAESSPYAAIVVTATPSGLDIQLDAPLLVTSSVRGVTLQSAPEVDK